MALEKILTTPESQSAIDKVRMYIKNVDPDKKLLKVELHKGFLDSGEFKSVKIVTVYITKDEYDAVMDTEGTTGITVRETLAEAIWTWLQTNGHIDVQ